MEDLKYSFNLDSDSPIMLLTDTIGVDNNGEGINGERFLKELMLLDSLNYKKITVKINSSGGSVIDGMSIFHSIRAAKTPIETECIGIAASIAAIIFQAGTKRIMNDYGILMIHNPSGGDDKSLFSFKEALLAMTTRTGYNKTKLSRLMDEETWMNGFDPKYLNVFWDEVKVSESITKNDLNLVLNKATTIVDSILKKEKDNFMINKIKDLLKLDTSLTDEQVLDYITNELVSHETTEKPKTPEVTPEVETPATDKVEASKTETETPENEVETPENKCDKDKNELEELVRNLIKDVEDLKLKLKNEAPKTVENVINGVDIAALVKTNTFKTKTMDELQWENAQRLKNKNK